MNEEMRETFVQKNENIIGWMNKEMNIFIKIQEKKRF